MATKLSRNLLRAICSSGLGLVTALAGFSTVGAQTYMTGVNIAGAEFGSLPGYLNHTYFYPSPDTIRYFASKGMNVIRVPFRWERLQGNLNGVFDIAELEQIDATIARANRQGMRVILDVHNSAAFNGKPLGTPDIPMASLAGLWGPLAARYKNNPRVIFGLMNEPHGLPTETWLQAANGAIAAIRNNGAGNLILVPGNGWTGAHSWFNSSYGTANRIVMLGVQDPLDNYALEVHQYLDRDFSGTNPTCNSETAGVKPLRKFTNWARANGKRAFLGEFGGGRDQICLAALDRMLRHMKQNRDVWRGWTYWAGGPWSPDYFTSVQPVDGIDRPQMTILKKYIAK